MNAAVFRPPNRSHYDLIMTGIACLISCVFLFGCCGCIKEPSESADVPAESRGLMQIESDVGSVTTMRPVFDDPSETGEEIQEQPAQILPAPLRTEAVPPVAPDVDSSGGFTGGVVHVCDDCVPCIWISHDLVLLAEFHGWVVQFGRRFDLNRQHDANWLVVMGGAESYPTIEFFNDGELIGRTEGYSCEPQFESRKESLRKLLNSHPLNLKNSKP